MVTEEGWFSDLGKVALSEKAAANILSQSRLTDDGIEVEYDPKEDHLIVAGKFVFGRKCFDNGAESPFYTCDLVEDDAYVSTVAEDLRSYTVREAQQANRAVHRVTETIETHVQHLRDWSTQWRRHEL